MSENTAPPSEDEVRALFVQLRQIRDGTSVVKLRQFRDGLPAVEQARFDAELEAAGGADLAAFVSSEVEGFVQGSFGIGGAKSVQPTGKRVGYWCIGIEIQCPSP